MNDDPDTTPSLVEQIDAEYARIRAAKVRLTQTCDLESRAILRNEIGAATERIWRLKRDAAEAGVET